MIICLIIALLSTFIDLTLIITDALVNRLNPYGGTGRTDEQAITISKVKYWLLLIMAVSWAIYIRLG